MTKLKESRRGRIVTVGMVALFVLAMGALWWKGLFSGRGPARGIQVSAGPFRVSARFEPDPPHTGKNRVTLTVTDSSGAPVEGARVSGAAVMPAMGAMQEMRSDGTLTDLGGGRYQLVFDLAMEGPWPLSLEIQASDGGEANLDFDFKTGIPVRVAGGEPGETAMHEKAESGAIRVDARRRQLIGVQTGRVERKEVAIEIRAVGRITYDETRLADIHLKYRGWVGKVFADYTGIAVEKGKPLFTLYAPELLSAQEELLESVRRAHSSPQREDALLENAKRRLRLWNLSDAQIDKVADSGKPSEYVPILSPVSGTVIEKDVVDGSEVDPGKRLYRIADLSRVWVEADVYESDLPLLEVSQSARISLSYLPGQSLTGTIAYVYPYLDPMTRTGRIRIEIPNPTGALKPDMYVSFKLSVAQGPNLVVPEGAVLRAGETNVVFLDRGDGHFEPRRIAIGRKIPEGYVVLSGLEEGDRVVTSGNYLIASESKLKAGIEKW